MSKMSEAAKRRIKDENIYAHSKHLLNIIWACRDNATYNGTQWYVKDQYVFLKMWSEFQYGCILGDGRKWYNRLNKQYEAYESEHGKCIKERLR